MEVGRKASLSRSFTAGDLADFAALTGQEVGHDSVPEPLVAALISHLLGVHLPGPGTNYLKQELVFHAPAPVGAGLTAEVEITRLRPEKQLVDLQASCRDADGRLICAGRSLVLARDVAG